MSTYREATIAGKAAKRGIVEQREQPQRSKKTKPVIVESRRAPDDARGKWLNREWHKWGAYRTESEADMAIATLERKYRWLEFRRQP